MGYVYMAGALACWTAMGFVYRWAEQRKANRMFMTAAMGLAASALVLIYVFAGRIDLHGADVSQWIVGASIGLVSLAGIPLFLAAVARGDLSITWTVLTLSFALASILSILYPGEHPSAGGVVGLTLAAGAVVLLGLDMLMRHRSNGPGKPRKGWFLFMSLAFLTNALTLYGFKLGAWLQPTRDVANSLGLLLSTYVVFSTGGLLLAPFILRRGSVKAAFVTGSVAGALLVVGGFCTLQALTVGNIPAHVLYPATTGGSNILVVVLSVILLGERPGRFGWSGIVTGAAALVVLNLAA